jgi:hypothetical protein
MSVRSEWYTECQYGVNDILNVSIEWTAYWMSVWSEWFTEWQYEINGILNVSTEWIIYWMSVWSEWYAECQYRLNHILNVSTEWLKFWMSVWSRNNECYSRAHSGWRETYWRSSSVIPCRKTVHREREGRRRERIRIGRWNYGVKRGK